MRRVAASAIGELTIREKNDDGEMVDVPYTMNKDELRAADMISRKVLPDRTAITIVDADEYDGMSVEDMQAMLVALIEGSPMLAKMTGMQAAVDRDNTVATIIPIKDEDADPA